jgi:hypothetical protein
MYKPGLSRAVPMGIIGFMVGALLVFVIRALQSLLPIWDPGVGLVFGTFFSAGFFVWGMGGFDPSMSAHGDGEHGHDDAHAAEEEVAAPTTILGYSIWQVLFSTIILLSLIGAFAWLGPKLTTVASTDANVGAIGMVPMNLFGTEIIVSQLVIFAGYILFAFASLGLVAGGIGFLINFLNRQMVETSPAGRAAAAALPAPTPAAPGRARPQWLSTLLFLVAFAVIFYVLYLLHYYVLIGLIFAWPEWQLTLASAGAAFTITLLILRGPWVVQMLARFAAWLAGVLRSRNNPYSGVRKNNRSNGQ